MQNEAQPRKRDRMVDRKWIVAEFGISLSTCRRIESAFPDFPRPCDFFTRVKRYNRMEVEAWFDKHTSSMGGDGSRTVSAEELRIAE